MPRFLLPCVALFALAVPTIASADDRIEEPSVAVAPIPASRWSLDVQLGSVTPFGAFAHAQSGVSIGAALGYRVATPLTLFVFGEHDALQRVAAKDAITPSSEIIGLGARFETANVEDFSLVGEIAAGVRFSRFANGDDHGSSNAYELRLAIGPSFRLADAFRLELLAEGAWIRPLTLHDGLDVAATPSSGFLGFSVGGHFSL